MKKAKKLRATEIGLKCVAAIALIYAIGLAGKADLRQIEDAALFAQAGVTTFVAGAALCGADLLKKQQATQRNKARRLALLQPEFELNNVLLRFTCEEGIQYVQPVSGDVWLTTPEELRDGIAPLLAAEACRISGKTRL